MLIPNLFAAGFIRLGVREGLWSPKRTKRSSRLPGRKGAWQRHFWIAEQNSRGWLCITYFYNNLLISSQVIVFARKVFFGEFCAQPGKFKLAK